MSASLRSRDRRHETTSKLGPRCCGQPQLVVLGKHRRLIDYCPSCGGRDRLRSSPSGMRTSARRSDQRFAG